MVVNLIHLYVADTVDSIHTFVPTVFLYSTTTKTHTIEQLQFLPPIISVLQTNLVKNTVQNYPCKIEA